MNIVRIVRLSFHSDKVNEFIEIFHTSKNQIRSFNGCLHLELLHDLHHKNVYYTYSKWESNDALEQYRLSNFFKETWARTKVLFDEKPSAYSLRSIELA